MGGKAVTLSVGQRLRRWLFCSAAQRRWLARAETLLREARPEGEDRLFDWRSRRLEALAVFEKLPVFRVTGMSREVAVARAGLLEQLERRKEALSVLRSVLRRGSAPDAWLLMLARLELDAGDGDAARKVLSRVRRKEGAFCKLEARLGGPDTRFKEYRRATRKLWRALVDGDKDRYRRHARRVLDENPWEASLRPLQPLLEAAYAFMHAPNELPPPTAAVPTAGQVIFCCGFGWSGSGAVFEFLLDHEGFDDLFSHAELRVLEYEEGGALGVIKAIRAGADVTLPVLRLVLGGLLGFAVMDSRGKWLNPKNPVLASWRKSPELLQRLVEECRHLLAGIQHAADPEDCVTGFLERLFQPRVPGGFTVVNNAIHAQRLDALQLLPNARAIVVIRDPADQFTARDIESPRKAGSSPQWFVGYHARLMARFRERLQVDSIARRAALVWFEDFVADAAVRQRVLAYAGAAGRPRVGATFDASRSVRNVGIWQRHPDAAAIEVIRESVSRETLVFPELALIAPG